MEWDKLLCATRLSRAGQVADHADRARASRSEFNKDYGRVLYSSAFRRLQDKTQVFPLGRNDYVRTRMTHSLEVENVGRGLAKRLRQVVAQHESARVPGLEDMEDAVAAVCLAHDIGNPPFGHSGEDAINAALQGSPMEGFCFEGNAQGFRLLAKVCDPINGCGLNLTVATLGAFVKYPCGPADRGPYKKFGIAAEEMPAFEQVAALCGLTPCAGHAAWVRHPLALLMEAADDISYLVADIEDAFFSRIITYEQCIRQLAAMAPSISDDKLGKMLLAASPHEQAQQVHYARAMAVGESMDDLGRVLECRYAELMGPGLPGSLMKCAERADVYARVREFSKRHIYDHESVLRIEIAGYQVLRDLIGLFMEWVLRPQSSLGCKIGDVLHAAPELKRAGSSSHDRFLHMIDYVSGMTDSYAIHTYNTLFGRSAF